jgi:hypothetical protein
MTEDYRNTTEAIRATAIGVLEDLRSGKEVAARVSWIISQCDRVLAKDEAELQERDLERVG